MGGFFVLRSLRKLGELFISEGLVNKESIMGILNKIIIFA